jgi:hypothetical protein
LTRSAPALSVLAAGLCLVVAALGVDAAAGEAPPPLGRVLQHGPVVEVVVPVAHEDGPLTLRDVAVTVGGVPAALLSVVPLADSGLADGTVVLVDTTGASRAGLSALRDSAGRLTGGLAAGEVAVVASLDAATDGLDPPWSADPEVLAGQASALRAGARASSRQEAVAAALDRFGRPDAPPTGRILVLRRDGLDVDEPLLARAADAGIDLRAVDPAQSDAQRRDSELDHYLVAATVERAGDLVLTVRGGPRTPTPRLAAPPEPERQAAPRTTATLLLAAASVGLLLVGGVLVLGSLRLGRRRFDEDEPPERSNRPSSPAPRSSAPTPVAAPRPKPAAPLTTDRATLVRPGPTRFALRVTEGPHAGKRFRLPGTPGGRVRTGGDSGRVDLLIDEATVSGHHLNLTIDGDRLVVEDVGSSNGTYVDGTDIRGRGPVTLEPGQKLQLGLLKTVLEAE